MTQMLQFYDQCVRFLSCLSQYNTHMPVFKLEGFGRCSDSSWVGIFLAFLPLWSRLEISHG